MSIFWPKLRDRVFVAKVVGRAVAAHGQASCRPGLRLGHLARSVAG